MYFRKQKIKALIFLLVSTVQISFPMARTAVRLGVLARRMLSSTPSISHAEKGYLHVPERIRLVLFNATPLLSDYKSHQKTIRRMEWQYFTACLLGDSLRYLRHEGKEVGLLFEDDWKGHPGIDQILEVSNFEEGYVVEGEGKNKIWSLSQMHKIPPHKILTIGWDAEHLKEAHTGPFAERQVWTTGISQPYMSSEELSDLVNHSVTLAENLVEATLTTKTIDHWIREGILPEHFSGDYDLDGQDD